MLTRKQKFLMETDSFYGLVSSVFLVRVAGWLVCPPTPPLPPPPAHSPTNSPSTLTGSLTDLLTQNQNLRGNVGLLAHPSGGQLSMAAMLFQMLYWGLLVPLNGFLKEKNKKMP